MSVEEDKRSVNLISNDNRTINVPISVAKLSTFIYEVAIDNDEAGDDDDIQEINIPNVRFEVLEKVIEFCRYYHEKESMKEIPKPLTSVVLGEMVQEFYCDFVKVDRQILFELITAANFLDIKPLLDLTCLAVAISIKGLSVKELKEIFNLGDLGNSVDEARHKK
mmetsp:Transcript_8201/g.11714  ORF Transcript_8201/g.11714 Transcript_8201/m.11714 type:complete len:165 (+) Transcript_8201:133-627(+)|eukprot:CAMPEP_0184857412 /NCGR_PEP_ID=MMETSP0580-20130426/2567_1 /TAXON_ID=1118495 /ORGANISM="Dactyliosolen fragilissimus" /LENGTH=164 /DNA_ID=CAMNT_0027352993 /DNA_START=119 /DNA_END=613 /DNA_ORIENTATION=-